MLTKTQADAKWREMKGAVRNLWANLSEEELERCRGNLYEVSSLIEERYFESREEIRLKIDQLLNSFDNASDAGRDPDVSSYHRSPLGHRSSRTPEDDEKNAQH